MNLIFLVASPTFGVTFRGNKRSLHSVRFPGKVHALVGIHSIIPAGLFIGGSAVL